MAFEHAYMPQQAESVFDGWVGGSNVAEGEIGAVSSTLIANNGTRVTTVAPGNSIRASVERGRSRTLPSWLPPPCVACVPTLRPHLSPVSICYWSAQVEDWLALAGVNLNDPNTALTPDYRDATKFPPFRSAGVACEV